MERLVALLLVLSVLAVGFPQLRTLILVLDGLAVLAVGIDFLRTPHPRSLDVLRGAPETAGLSQDFVRRVRIEAGAAGGLECEIREEFSLYLDVRARSLLTASARGEPYGEERGLYAVERGGGADPTGGPDRVRLPAQGPIDVLRVYRSRRRGMEWLGDMRLRLTGPLGLIMRQGLLSGRLPISIEPPLLGLSHTLRLAASDRWHDLGVRQLRRQGGHTEFESLRDYVIGDDVRQIDWKAFARRGRPTVRQFQVERGQELILAVDVGRRMSISAPDRMGTAWTKLDHALDASLQLAAVALAKGDRVGIAAFDARLLAYVAPARGPRQLERLRKAVEHLLPSGIESDLGRALRELGVRHPRRALLLLVTDVADPLSVGEQRRALGAAGRHHQVLLASLDDPEVRQAADAVGRDAHLRAAALELLAERDESLRELRGSGVRVLDALPAEAAAPLLAAWLDARRG